MTFYRAADGIISGPIRKVLSTNVVPGLLNLKQRRKNMDAIRWNRMKKTQFREQYRKKFRRVTHHEPTSIRIIVVTNITGDIHAEKQEKQIQKIATIAEIVGSKAGAVGQGKTRSGVVQVLP